MQKLYYLIKSNKVLLVSILKKLNLTTIIFINKLNLYLVCAKEYFFKFLLLIWHKPNKANFVLNILSCLFTINNLKLEAINSIIKISLTKKKENLICLLLVILLQMKLLIIKCITSLINIILLLLLLLKLHLILRRNSFKDINWTFARNASKNKSRKIML
jgi:hypothetical protein